MNDIFASYMQCGQEYAQCGSGMGCGLSAANEVVKHEFRQKGNPTSGISTTPHLVRAKVYATREGEYPSGHIFKIDRTKFSLYGVTEYIVSEIVPFPSIPEDEEIIIVASDFGPIPDEVITSIDYFTF
ncbi:MAG: hypothetical protein HN590_15355 [Calditrichaeota bacterium]|nr:hypothetical protein [Calditrichota bacterium]MBT7710696.1 hypothetical protein [Deltaproteobacteria bacterium]